MFNWPAARARHGRYLLLLGADSLLRERAIVSALRTYPGPLVGMTDTPVASANRFFDHVLASSPYHAKDALTAVEAFERETGLRPEAVVPILEMNLHVAVAIAGHYDLPTLSDECLRRVRDKHTMKLAFERAGVPCARHRPFGTLDELRVAAAQLGYPLVVKPRDFAGSVGTVRVDGPDQLTAAYEHCRASLLEVAPTYEFADGRFQAEEYVESTHEVSVEVANYEGHRVVLAVTDKSTTAPPYFAETGQLVPSRETDNDALRRLAVDACAALLIERGIAHVEVLVGPRRMAVVEVAARPGGDAIMDLVDRVYGFNPYDLHIAAYRRTFDTGAVVPTQPHGIGAVTFLKAPVGTIAAVCDAAEVVAEPDPTEVALYVTARAGARSRPMTSYLARDAALECFGRGCDETQRDEFRARVEALAARRCGELFTVTADTDGSAR